MRITTSPPVTEDGTSYLMIVPLVERLAVVPPCTMGTDLAFKSKGFGKLKTLNEVPAKLTPFTDGTFMMAKELDPVAGAPKATCLCPLNVARMAPGAMGAP